MHRLHVLLCGHRIIRLRTFGRRNTSTDVHRVGRHVYQPSCFHTGEVLSPSRGLFLQNCTGRSAA